MRVDLHGCGRRGGDTLRGDPDAERPTRLDVAGRQQQQPRDRIETQEAGAAGDDLPVLVDDALATVLAELLQGGDLLIGDALTQGSGLTC